GGFGGGEARGGAAGRPGRRGPSRGRRSRRPTWRRAPAATGSGDGGRTGPRSSARVGSGPTRGAGTPRLVLSLQQELRDFGRDLARALVELRLGEVRYPVRSHQELVGRYAPLLSHGTRGLREDVRDDRGRRHRVLLQHDSVEHTARRAGPSVSDAGNDDVAGLAHLLDDLLVRRD